MGNDEIPEEPEGPEEINDDMEDNREPDKPDEQPKKQNKKKQLSPRERRTRGMAAAEKRRTPVKERWILER